LTAEMWDLVIALSALPECSSNSVPAGKTNSYRKAVPAPLHPCCRYMQ